MAAILENILVCICASGALVQRRILIFPHTAIGLFALMCEDLAYNHS